MHTVYPPVLFDPGQQDEVTGNLVCRDEPMGLCGLTERKCVVKQRLDPACTDLFQSRHEVLHIARHRSTELLLGKEQATDVERDLWARRKAIRDHHTAWPGDLDALAQRVAPLLFPTTRSEALAPENS
jgi:hypothetical protein